MLDNYWYLFFFKSICMIICELFWGKNQFDLFSVKSNNFQELFLTKLLNWLFLKDKK